MREYLVVFLVAGVVSYLLCVFAREAAIRSGAVARVRDRDVHATPIPYFGGVAMLGGLGAGLLMAHRLPFLSTSQPFVFHDSGYVLLAGAMICAVGSQITGRSLRISGIEAVQCLCRTSCSFPSNGAVPARQ